MAQHREAYGSDSQQFGTLHLPLDRHVRRPVVVLIHGGFWKEQYEHDLMTPLADDLAERGIAVWNLEYRRVGQSPGGYLDTLADVAAGIDHLAALSDRYGLDLEHLGVVGHSAGGHLALWSASRGLLHSTSIGAAPTVSPAIVVGQAAVTDLTSAAALNLGNGAVQNFLGGDPSAARTAYRLAQPVVGAIPTILVHGSADDVVPVSFSTRFVDKATVLEVEGEDHFTIIDPTSQSWLRTIDALRPVLFPPR